MAKIGVVLSGCGYLDGSEITEAVSALLALDRAGAQAICFAPVEDQADVINHLNGEEEGQETRSVLKESARIARGQVQPLTEARAGDLDGLVFPGGFGAAKNLCTFATQGPECWVHPEVERLVGEMLDSGKPIGAMCIAPALIARITGKRGFKVKLTIGNHAATAEAIETMGGQHIEAPAGGHVVDEQHKIVSTPAYMFDSGPAAVYEGIEKLVEDVLQLAPASAAK